MPLKLLIHAEQVAEYLCAEIRKGRWTGTMPGAVTLQQELGIPTGDYNLPDWKDDRKGFHLLLDSLFRHTPPTAPLMDAGPLFVAAQQALIQRGLVVPRDVSMICMEPDVAFEWCDPAISHINFESRPWMRHILRWVKNAAYGREDRHNTVTPAEFIEGGTIAPVPARKKSDDTNTLLK